MIQKININNKSQMISIAGNYYNVADIHDVFYYDITIPIQKIAFSLIPTTVTYQQIQFIVIRHKSSLNLVVMNKSMLKYIPYALGAKERLPFLNDENTLYNKYDRFCIDHNEELKRIPNWLAEERRHRYTETAVSKIYESLIMDTQTDSSPISNICDSSNEKEIDTNISTDFCSDKGIDTVDYVLKWLEPYGCISIKRDCFWRNNQCIRLLNSDFIDESQEFDHIVVMNDAILMIETKNYKGEIIIDEYGNWIRKTNNESIGMRNPAQQIDRHMGILKSIIDEVEVNSDLPVIGILCLSHPEVIIKGIENSGLNIIKSDLLHKYITSIINRHSLLNHTDKMNIVNHINRYKVYK